MRRLHMLHHPLAGPCHRGEHHRWMLEVHWRRRIAASWRPWASHRLDAPQSVRRGAITGLALLWDMLLRLLAPLLLLLLLLRLPRLLLRRLLLLMLARLCGARRSFGRAVYLRAAHGPFDLQLLAVREHDKSRLVLSNKAVHSVITFKDDEAETPMVVRRVGTLHVRAELLQPSLLDRPVLVEDSAEIGLAHLLWDAANEHLPGLRLPRLTLRGVGVAVAGDRIVRRGRAEAVKQIARMCDPLVKSRRWTGARAHRA
mmetsp:Transcript_33483/g.96098  ORF Transcript_33483/g.96098 Transcript_33483/m.96098 type:complete len:257 (+) Transcript_33483:915-1685(+)